MSSKYIFIFILSLACINSYPQNLLQNPSFERGEAGWFFWLREEGKGRASVSTNT